MQLSRFQQAYLATLILCLLTPWTLGLLQTTASFAPAKFFLVQAAYAIALCLVCFLGVVWACCETCLGLVFAAAFFWGRICLFCGAAYLICLPFAGWLAQEDTLVYVLTICWFAIEIWLIEPLLWGCGRVFVWVYFVTSWVRSTADNLTTFDNWIIRPIVGKSLLEEALSLPALSNSEITTLLDRCVVRAVEPQQLCSICLQTAQISTYQFAFHPDCEHRFHKTCLQIQLRKKGRCPQCNKGTRLALGTLMAERTNKQVEMKLLGHGEHTY